MVQYSQNKSRLIFNLISRIKQKSEVLEKFKEFVTMTENITKNHVKILRSDNGGENTSKLFDAYLKEKGIIHQTTAPNNTSQNGTAERM